MEKILPHKLYKQLVVNLSMVKKKVTSSGIPGNLKKMSAAEREQILIENFIGLQKAMTHLSMKFESLSENINKLLNIFEVSARDYMLNKGKNPLMDREILTKLNELIDQNKNSKPSSTQATNMPKPLPTTPQMPQQKSANTNLSGYTQSIQIPESPSQVRENQQRKNPI